MVTQKRTCRFRGKVDGIFGGKLLPERQRSGDAQTVLRQRSDVAQDDAQVGFTEMNLRRLHPAF